MEGGEALRDSSIEGTLRVGPIKGGIFGMTAPPRDGGNLRVITTSRIEEVQWFEREKKWRFTTLSGSVYEVQMLEQPN
jgi:hypothetical protein